MIRIALAREFAAPTRTDDEEAALSAQVNVARADFMAKNARLENFEASLHLTPYEVHGERWSLSALDKQIARRREDAKFVPDRAARLDWRSLARLNYSSAGRREAGDEVEHLKFVRAEVSRQIEQRREPLIEDRKQAYDSDGCPICEPRVQKRGPARQANCHEKRNWDESGVKIAALELHEFEVVASGLDKSEERSQPKDNQSVSLRWGKRQPPS